MTIGIYRYRQVKQAEGTVVVVGLGRAAWPCSIWLIAHHPRHPLMTSLYVAWALINARHGLCMWSVFVAVAGAGLLVSLYSNDQETFDTLLDSAERFMWNGR